MRRRSLLFSCLKVLLLGWPLLLDGTLAGSSRSSSSSRIALKSHFSHYHHHPHCRWGAASQSSPRPPPQTTSTAPRSTAKKRLLLWTKNLRGGYENNDKDEELSEKVRKAMIKLGLTPPSSPLSEDSGATQNTNSQTNSINSNNSKDDGDDDDECQGGVCELVQQETTTTTTTTTTTDDQADLEEDEEAQVLAAQLAAELHVDESLCMAALGATALFLDDEGMNHNQHRHRRRRQFQIEKARALLQQEIDRINTVSESSAEVQQLVSEGFDLFLSRRALVFADGNVEDARAILLADQMDEQQQQEPQVVAHKESNKKPSEPMKTVTINSDFDPTKVQQEQEKPNRRAPEQGVPQPAKKSDVVFEATAAQIQELVLESPVPVLLDIYADWCGPCKVLGPALEEMAVKSGGAFRLVKVNTDKERVVSSGACLGVTALPTVFGIRNGKILNMFQGMPRSEAAIRSFMMGLLVSESSFDPPVSAAEKKQYAELTTKLIKMAGLASFPFSARERLHDRVLAQLDELTQVTLDFVECEESVSVIKLLLSNVIKDPSSIKFRTINLTNKVIASKVARMPPSVAILKLVGFSTATSTTSEAGEGETLLVLGQGRKVVNVAPLLIARDCIEKWIDKSRYELARAARKRRDEDDRARLQLDSSDEALSGDNDKEDESEEEEEKRDPNACILKVRFDSKNKIHELVLDADEPLAAVLDHLSIKEAGDVQLTCVARRLTIQSSDKESMGKSLRNLGLFPSSYLVVTVGDHNGARRSKSGGVTSLSKRVAAKQKKKKGSHTMQSVGIYAKDDNNKAELIDGGGGVWYEHDVTDDDEEEPTSTRERGTNQTTTTSDAEESLEYLVSESASADEFGED